MCVLCIFGHMRLDLLKNVNSWAGEFMRRGNIALSPHKDRSLYRI